VPTQPAEQRASSGAGEGGAVARALLTSRQGERQALQEHGNAAGGKTAERLAALQRRLAALEASVQNQEDASSTAPRVRTLTAVSARSAVEADYLQAWRERLETVGNAWYPRASLRYGLYGTLRLRVLLRSDGSLESVKLLDSSGYAVLDEAALKIVRLAAPYAPFPPALRAKADKLEIIRTWDFAPTGG
ncbi:energy transducer TonB, partial [Pseudohaliea rubra]|uniref:energy transducer TonB n=1 Tax=Pseudohaliea rubra TaxID=475795 RepID=UPI0011853B59